MMRNVVNAHLVDLCDKANGKAYLALLIPTIFLLVEQSYSSLFQKLGNGSTECLNNFPEVTVLGVQVRI